MSSEKQVLARTRRNHSQTPKAFRGRSNGEELKTSRGALGPVSAQRRQMMIVPHHKLLLQISDN